MNTKDKTQNRWPEVFSKFGIDGGLLDGKHHAFPEIGCNTDGFRYIDKQGDGYCCLGNGEFGTGFDLLMKLYGWDFQKAANEIDAAMGWSDGDYIPLTKEESAAIKAKHAKAAAKRENSLTEQHRIAAKQSLALWEGSAIADDSHAYLKAKNVKAFGINMDGEDLLIPVRIGGNITSVQRIKPDGSKLFHTGGEVSGGYHSIVGADVADMSRICIAEGYATGATIREATGCHVAVAFNAGNLGNVAKAIRSKLPDIQIVIAGDNDESKTGETKGKAAADSVGGLFVMPPDVGNDWNDYAATHGLEAVRKEIANALKYEAGDDALVVPVALPDKAGKTSQASSLVALAEQQEGTELFHNESGAAYVTVAIKGVHKTLAVRGKDYRNLLRRELYQQDGRNASAQAMDDALGTIEGKALFDGAEYVVNLRTAGDSAKSIQLDLCNERWQSVHIDADGWRVVSYSAVKWRRNGGMRPLPMPATGGRWQSLFDIFPLPYNEQVLVIAWLVMALNPKGPYPVLILQGEQGTGKSTFAKLLRGLIDPNAAPIRTTPRSEHDLIIAAQNGWVIVIDNLSGMPPWLSDGLCRLATGGGFAGRALYSNDEEHIIEATRPIIINGIDDMAARPDLADRAIILNLEPIDKANVKTEQALQLEYEQKRPAIMGALLDAVSMGMRKLSTTHLAEYPRMADFAQFISAAESALWESGRFMQAYTKARSEAVAAGLDGSPVAQAMRSMMASRQSWKGTATDLLDALSDRVDEQTRRLKVWPKTARGLSNIITRLSPSFRADGIDVSRRHDKKRLIVIDKVTDEADAKPPCAIPAGIRKKEGESSLGGGSDTQKEFACISASVRSVSSVTLETKGKTADLSADLTNNADLRKDATDARDFVRLTLKPLQDNETDAADLTDARIHTQSCDLPANSESLTPVNGRVRGWV